MKKTLAILAAALLAFVIAGCGCNSQGAGTVVHGEIAWSYTEDAAAAAASAGFTSDFVVPNPPPVGDYDWSEPTFTAMDNVAEAVYDGKGIAISIRKGEGVPLEELSADTTGYTLKWTWEVDGIEVTCHGFELDVANFIEWEADGCSYDVWCMSTGAGILGMSEAEVAAMVNAVH